MKVKSESEVAQLCPTLSDPMDCSLPGPSVHWIFQARVLEWGAIAFLLTLCLNDLSIDVSEALKYPSIIMLLSVSPCRSLYVLLLLC